MAGRTLKWAMPATEQNPGAVLVMSVMLLTNNPHMRDYTPGLDWCPATAPEASPSFSGQKAGQKNGAGSGLFFDGSAMPVLIAARDRIQGGWRLLNHPLYGNFRPHQQPFRSLLLRFEAGAFCDDGPVSRIVADDMSLHLIEEALIVYRSAPVLEPAALSAALRRDCGLIDCELMRLSLLQAGLPEDGLAHSA